MKPIKGKRRVLRGVLDTGTYGGIENKIILFDGKFNTGWKIERFVITPTQPVATREIAAILSTEPKSSLGNWNFSDVEQLAWGSWSVPTGNNGTLFELVDEENMAVEDLWIQSYTTGEATTMNYYIVLQKYEFTSYDGAAVMVKNQSQSGSST